MNVMRVDWNPVDEEYPVVARFVQAQPRPAPKAPDIEDEPVDDDEDEPQAKVVRAPQRKGPRPSSRGAQVK